SPYFKNYELYYGVSYNPESWQKINLENNEYQIVNENIHIFDLTNLIDTVYTIRLLVNTIDNNTFEERSSFIIDRTVPVIISHSLFSAMLNDIETVQASIITNENVTAQLFYRTQNSDENFKSLYLDGFSQDVKVVSKKHFGILPISEVLTEVNHEFYFEVTNQAGLKTILKDGANYFKSENVIENNIQNRDFNDLSLPAGRIFPQTVIFAGFNSNFILLNENTTSADLSIYDIQNQNFTKMNSLKNRIPVSVGDFNNDGKTDILNLFVQRGFIETQKSVGSLEFETVFSDTSGNFWPALAENIDDDSNTEIIVFSSDTTIAVWEVQSDFNLTLESELKIFSSGENQTGKSIFRNNQVVVGDFDNDNKNEIVAADNFGRLIVYEIANNNSFKNDFIVETFYTIESNTLISKGDFNSDGILDIGIISQFENNEFITPLIYTSVFTFKENKSEILFQTMLITTENKFIRSFEKSYSAINFADLNNDSKDELIIFSNPNAYVFENDLDKAKLIFYQTNVNTQSILAGDLDGNQIPEIAIPDGDSFRFIEFQSNGNLRT
ncbi:MAG: VCBS repeat-containing protein, partial [Ignavibacteriae bacterium]|nr:VCBS repeat-containing protein [Ignavibacteriota bacterium]